MNAGKILHGPVKVNKTLFTVARLYNGDSRHLRAVNTQSTRFSALDGADMSVFLLACVPHRGGVGHSQYFTCLPHDKYAPSNFLNKRTTKDCFISTASALIL